MDSHSLAVLEYDAVISMLRDRTACALGDDLARRLEPSADLLTIREGLRETGEALTIIEEEGALPLGGIHDIRPQVTRAAMDALLDPSELLSVAETLSSGRRLRTFVQKRESLKLAEIAANIGQHERLEKSVEATVSDTGEVRDTASPELARIRSKLKTLHSRLAERLQGIMHSEHRSMIQDPVITQRGGRYCVPVKAEHRHQFPGIVHDVSGSGATVFMEPTSVMETANELVELFAKEQREIERILRKLSGEVAAQAPEITITLSALARLDLASAKGMLAADMDAVEPVLSRDGRVEFEKARHPLLSGEVVPIDVELGKRFRTLLITGPNTGGKTVTLKTIGLLTLMAQSGLFVPAQSAETGVFEAVFADIGDEQSIEQSLSTFSAHMTNIVEIMGSLGGSALVLLDEIGAGTDPAEGAALAKAILDHLHSRGAVTVATTHYGELKEYAFAREGVENASVEFDSETLRPTYRLMVGVPGESNAFAIAVRLGLPEGIVRAAGELVSGGEATDTMIRRIEESYRSASEREQLAEQASRDADILRSRYEARLAELDELRRQMGSRFADEVDARVREKLAELDEILSELKQRPAEKEVQQGRERFRKKVREIRSEIAESLPKGPEPTEHTFKAGDRVRVASFGAEGDLLNEPGEGDALVSVGTIKVSVPFSDLRPVRREKPRREASSVPMARTANVSPEIMLIAQRAEEALENLDKYLDDACLAGLSSVRIIHGKGTGALRKAVWEFLKGHHAIASYRLANADEGGAGATVAEFK
ncbi:MAG: endonuclease MutS2 [Armatimonadota bacterium]